MTEDEKARAPSAPTTAAAELNEAEDLRVKLTEAEHKAAENWDRYLRTAAELENLRKRTERDLENMRKFALEDVLYELLSIADSLDLGLAAGRDESADRKAVVEGMELTQRQLAALMERCGVTVLDPSGQAFDPKLHEAVSTQPSAAVPVNHVIKVMQKGYRLHDRLLRPALVVVARAPTTGGGRREAGSAEDAASSPPNSQSHP